LEFKEIAPGEKIPVLGLGTWRIGGGETADYSRDKIETKTLQKGIELGYTHIDTAEYYGNGHCEEIVGRAIASFDRRELFLTTKVWHNHLKYDKLIESMKSSLKRLEQDYVDLYLVHWPNENVPIEETMKAMEHCVAEGYTRFIGVSNFSTKLLEEAQAALKDNKLVANQVKYSLVEQAPKTEQIPFCVEHDIMLIAYTPLARGVLTRESNPVLDEMAEKYSRTHAQISLNWLISQENVITIPKASRLEHLKDNLGTVGWKLDRGDADILAKAFTQSK
jgi:diketogulonate reductase-like aldo/keto reductase